MRIRRSAIKSKRSLPALVVGNTTQQHVPQTCAECFATSSEIQRTSIRNSLSWIHAFFLDAESGSAPQGDMTLSCRTARCDNCPYETPFARDNTLAANTAEPLEDLAGVTIETDPIIQERLLNGANEWALGQMFVDVSTTFEFGVFSRHAVIVANNLLCGAQPGSPAAGVPRGEKALDEATRPSLKAMQDFLQSEDTPSRAITAGDLITVQWIRDGIHRAMAYAQANRHPKPTGTYRKERAATWKLIAATVLALALIVPLGVFPTHALGILSGLAAVAIGIATGIAWRGRRIEIVKQPPAWITALVQWASAKEHAALLEAFSALDLLSHAGTLFADTPADCPRDAAVVLRHAHAGSGGPSLCKWVANRAVRAFANGGHGRLSQVGIALLDDDYHSRGTDMAGLLINEMLVQHRTFEEGGRLWAVLADDHGGSEGMPTFLGYLMRRAAVLNRGRVYWSPREGAFIRRCCEAARTWLTRIPLADPNWHLLQVRILRDMLRRGVSSVQFPADSGYSLSRICSRVESSFESYERTGAKSPVFKEAQAVMSVPGFRHSCQFLAQRDKPVDRPQPYARRRFPTALDHELLRRFGPSAKRQRPAASTPSEAKADVTGRTEAKAKRSTKRPPKRSSTVANGLLVSEPGHASPSSKAGRKQRKDQKGRKRKR